MLKFIKHHLETITGIEVFPVISFIIFFGFFLLMIGWLFLHDKKQLDDISKIPLD